MRPHRYALVLALARDPVLGEHDIVMHEVCDVPLCVHAEAVGGHLEAGTQAPRTWPRWAVPGGVGT